ncbi:unnamed protein product [Rotaria sp. Silwood1]|nr:unnamed protein product [Rotaria sp. Silwood1]
MFFFQSITHKYLNRLIRNNLFITINETDLPSNFLSYLLEFTRNNWQYEQRNQVINNILSLIKIFSKIPMIIHSQWPNACIPWLKKIGSRPSYTTDFLINLILQKLARHTIAIEILNCTKILIESHKQMKKRS